MGDGGQREKFKVHVLELYTCMPTSGFLKIKKINIEPEIYLVNGIE